MHKVHRRRICSLPSLFASSALALSGRARETDSEWLMYTQCGSATRSHARARCRSACIMFHPYTADRPFSVDSPYYTVGVCTRPRTFSSSAKQFSIFGCRSAGWFPARGRSTSKYFFRSARKLLPRCNTLKLVRPWSFVPGVEVVTLDV